MSLITGTGTITFKCSRCGTQGQFSAEAAVFDAVERERRASALYTQHQLFWADECANCGTDISATLIVYEYPCGQIDGKDKTVENAEIISGLEEFELVLTPIEPDESL